MPLIKFSQPKSPSLVLTGLLVAGCFSGSDERALQAAEGALEAAAPVEFRAWRAAQTSVIEARRAVAPEAVSARTEAREALNLAESRAQQAERDRDTAVAKATLAVSRVDAVRAEQEMEVRADIRAEVRRATAERLAAARRSGTRAVTEASEALARARSAYGAAQEAAREERDAALLEPTSDLEAALEAAQVEYDAAIEVARRERRAGLVRESGRGGTARKVLHEYQAQGAKAKEVQQAAAADAERAFLVKEARADAAEQAALEPFLEAVRKAEDALHDTEFELKRQETTVSSQADGSLAAALAQADRKATHSAAVQEADADADNAVALANIMLEEARTAAATLATGQRTFRASSSGPVLRLEAAEEALAAAEQRLRTAAPAAWAAFQAATIASHE